MSLSPTGGRHSVDAQVSPWTDFQGFAMIPVDIFVDTRGLYFHGERGSSHVPGQQAVMINQRGRRATGILGQQLRSIV